MGCFSWCYAEPWYRKVPMLIGVSEDSFLLVPKPFQEQYGKAIVNHCYDGYGNFGGYDVYELVALWNQDYVSEKKLQKFFGEEPRPEEYCGLWDYQKESLKREGLSDAAISKKDKEKKAEKYHRAVRHYEYKKAYLTDFFLGKLSEKQLIKKYDNKDILREIGIDIACENKDARLLKYPIKITRSLLDYDSVKYSLVDEGQGL